MTQQFEFERYPRLCGWMLRFASHGMSMTMLEWQDFTEALEEALRAAADGARREGVEKCGCGCGGVAIALEVRKAAARSASYRDGVIAAACEHWPPYAVGPCPECGATTPQPDPVAAAREVAPEETHAERYRRAVDEVNRMRDDGTIKPKDPLP